MHFISAIFTPRRVRGVSDRSRDHFPGGSLLCGCVLAVSRFVARARIKQFKCSITQLLHATKRLQQSSAYVFVYV